MQALRLEETVRRLADGLRELIPGLQRQGVRRPEHAHAELVQLAEPLPDTVHESHRI